LNRQWGNLDKNSRQYITQIGRGFAPLWLKETIQSCSLNILDVRPRGEKKEVLSKICSPRLLAAERTCTQKIHSFEDLNSGEHKEKATWQPGIKAEHKAQMIR